ncbi:hypothetical protein Pelo_8507 [Pelomyxa schiedti]|nr:hypothetical protein Pelo_8507 [Pelomyxa schiedti]
MQSDTSRGGSPPLHAGVDASQGQDQGGATPATFFGELVYKLALEYRSDVANLHPPRCSTKYRNMLLRRMGDPFVPHGEKVDVSKLAPLCRRKLSLLLSTNPGQYTLHDQRQLREWLELVCNNCGIKPASSLLNPLTKENRDILLRELNPLLDFLEEKTTQCTLIEEHTNRAEEECEGLQFSFKDISSNNSSMNTTNTNTSYCTSPTKPTSTTSRLSSRDTPNTPSNIGVGISPIHKRETDPNIIIPESPTRNCGANPGTSSTSFQQPPFPASSLKKGTSVPADTTTSSCCCLSEPDQQDGLKEGTNSSEIVESLRQQMADLRGMLSNSHKEACELRKEADEAHKEVDELQKASHKSHTELLHYRVEMRKQVEEYQKRVEEAEREIERTQEQTHQQVEEYRRREIELKKDYEMTKREAGELRKQLETMKTVSDNACHVAELMRASLELSQQQEREARAEAKELREKLNATTTTTQESTTYHHNNFLQQLQQLQSQVEQLQKASSLSSPTTPKSNE